MADDKSEEFRGKTVEAAISAGLAILRLSREEVDVEVVRPGSRGVLGIGAEDAIVRLTPIRATRPARVEPQARTAPRAETRQQPSPVAQPARPPERAAERPAEPRQSDGRPAAETRAAEVRAAETRTTEARPALAPDEKASAAAEKGREILSGLLQRMGLRATVEVTTQSDAEADEDGDRAMVLNIIGDDLGVLIGRQNETLSALEFLTRLMVNQQVRTRTSFIVDVNGYRAKRAESLRKLAHRMAQQASESGRTVALEPMPPAERRIIHLALREHPTVTTTSIGEGDRRKVTIVPKKG